MALFNNKDKYAYFKDNVQTPENHEELDLARYYYNRDNSGIDHVQQDGRGFNGYMPSQMNQNAFMGQGQPPSSIGGGPRPQGVPSNVSRAQSVPSQQQVPSFAQDTSHFMTHGPPMQQRNTSASAPGGSVGPNSGMYPQHLSGSVSGVPASTSSQSTYASRALTDPNATAPILYDHTNFPALNNPAAGNTIRYNAQGHLSALSSRDEEFIIHTEDFPALPSSKLDASPSDHGGSSGNFQGTIGQRSAIGAPGQKTAPVGSQSGSATSSPGLPSKDAKFGLLGLLDVIRMTDKDLNTLALGSDLTTFGLNLNSSEPIYASFSSPFADQPSLTEPQYTTPGCYIMHPPTLKSEHLSKFQLETLFYLFYSMPRDVLQACAAQELYRREWRYHGELKLWLKVRSAHEQIQSHPGVQYVYFDVTAWDAKLFTSNLRGNVAAGFLSEEDVRLKAPTSSPGAPVPVA